MRQPMDLRRHTIVFLALPTADLDWEGVVFGKHPVIALLRTKAIGCSAEFNPIG